MVEMLIDRLGAVEDTLRVRMDKMENAIDDLNMKIEPRLQDLTSELARGSLARRIINASRIGWTACHTNGYIPKDDIEVLKRNGFRVMCFRGADPHTTVSWAPEDQPPVYPDELWEKV